MTNKITTSEPTSPALRVRDLKPGNMFRYVDGENFYMLTDRRTCDDEHLQLIVLLKNGATYPAYESPVHLITFSVTLTPTV